MKKQLIAAIAGFVSLSMLFAACKKNDNSGPVQDANILLVNMSSGDSLPYDFYFNDAKLNTQAISYPNHSSYLALKPGNYSIKVAATNTINPLATTSAGIGSGKSYSVFSYDTLNAGKVKIFAVEDDLSAPAAGKAKVRFFHLSPVNLAVDILVNDSVVFANRSYADNVSNSSKGAFISLNGGVYNIKVKLAGSSSAVPALLSMDNVSLTAGQIYTISAKGTVSGTGVNALGADMIINKSN